jgi:RNA polymerase sigma-70 factor (ECF subfamily)
MFFLLYPKMYFLFYSINLMTQDRDLFSRLMADAQSGSSESYHKLLSQISVLLSKFLARRIGSADDREDLLQEILLAIHNSRHTYLPARPFYPWMYAIAKNTLVKYYKRISKEYLVLMGMEIDTFVTPEIAETEDKEKSSQLLQWIQKLPRKQKEIILLLKVEGRSIKEVAKQLKLSEANVRVIAHRGYQTLRTQVKK